MLCATVAAVALLAVPGCSKVITGTAVPDPSRAGSQKQSVRTGFSAPDSPSTHTPTGEPQLRIPQPPGWERASMLDSDVIRFTMRNKDLAADNFMPTAVVTLESVPGRPADNKAIFDQERAALVDRLGATGLHTTETTLLRRRR